MTKVYRPETKFTYNYVHFDRQSHDKAIADYKSKVHRELIGKKYTGKYTGETIRIPYADGYAEYLVGDTGKSISLFHLDILDGYHSPLATKLTRHEIIELINREHKLANLFGAR